MRWLILGLGVAAIAWFAQSSSFQVQELIVNGAVRSDASDILFSQGFDLGHPLVQLRPAAAEAALLADPWVDEATVEIEFPNTVVVNIVERIPVAQVSRNSSYVWVSDRGYALAVTQDKGSPTIKLGGLSIPPLGLSFSDMRVLGLAEFFSFFPVELSASTVATERDGELWLDLEDLELQVRLGRPVEMEAKAAALAGLLAQGIEGGSIINLIAPQRPAVVDGPPETEE